MNTEIIGFFTMVWTLSTTFLLMKKYKHAPLLKSFSYIMWLTFGMSLDNQWIVMTNIVMFFISIWGWNKWKKE